MRAATTVEASRIIQNSGAVRTRDLIQQTYTYLMEMTWNEMSWYIRIFGLETNDIINDDINNTIVMLLYMC